MPRGLEPRGSGCRRATCPDIGGLRSPYPPHACRSGRKPARRRQSGSGVRPFIPIRLSPMSSGRSIRRAVSVSRQTTGWVWLRLITPSEREYSGAPRRFYRQTTTVEVTVKKLLGALAVAGMAVVFSPSGADAAACWWNGYTWVCRTPSYAGHWRHHHWRGHHWREARGPWGWHHRHWRHWDRPYAWYR